MLSFANDSPDSGEGSSSDEGLSMNRGVSLNLAGMFSNWQIGKDYTLGRKLGVGVYGTVMEAFHVPTKKTVAIKRFDRLFERDLKCKRFLRELKIL